MVARALEQFVDSIEVDGELVKLSRDDREVVGRIERTDETSALAVVHALSSVLLQTDESQLALVSAPEVTRAVETQLEKFVAEHASERAWGFVDDAGDARLVIPEYDLDERKRNVIVEAGAARIALTTHPGSVTVGRNQSLFTDLNQWLLKVLILNHAPPEVWDRPRLELRGPADLSRTDWVDVSQGKAYQFAHTLKDMGYLVWKRGVFRLVEVERLLDSWLAVARSQRPYRTPVRSLMGDDVRRVFESNSTQYAFAGALAAETYGLRHVSESIEEVYVFDAIDELMEEAMLEVCEDTRATFYLIRPTDRAAVERAVQLRENHRVVDLIQVALDSSRRRARGPEQADFVVSEIVRWFE